MSKENSSIFNNAFPFLFGKRRLFSEEKPAFVPVEIVRLMQSYVEAKSNELKYKENKSLHEKYALERLEREIRLRFYILANTRQTILGLAEPGLWIEEQEQLIRLILEVNPSDAAIQFRLIKHDMTVNIDEVLWTTIDPLIGLE